MQTILIYTILIVILVFTGLTILIICGKAWRETVEMYHRSRRKELEPAILAYAHGERVSILPVIGGKVRARDRHIVQTILLEFIQRVRGVEQERLGRALDELGFVARNIERLKSSRWWSRADAAEKLGLSGAVNATEALVATLDDQVPEVRIRAASALGRVGGKASVVPLIEALGEPNRWSTIRIADILTSMGPEVVKELTDEWDGMNGAAKLACIDILGRIRLLNTATWLRERLEDEDPDLRARAAHALGSIGEPGSAPHLEERLTDSEWPVRAMAAKALGRIRHRPSIPMLAAATRDQEWWVRANAAEALRLMGDEGLATLEGLLEDEDRYARHQAVLMLGQAGVIDEWVEALNSRDDVAKEKLMKVVRSGQIGRLRELADHHGDAVIRTMLQDMLPEIIATDEEAE